MMAKFKDGLGKVYDIPDEELEAFERARRPLLIAKVIVQLILLLGLLAYIVWG